MVNISIHNYKHTQHIFIILHSRQMTPWNITLKIYKTNYSIDSEDEQISLCPDESWRVLILVSFPDDAPVHPVVRLRTGAAVRSWPSQFDLVAAQMIKLRNITTTSTITKIIHFFRRDLCWKEEIKESYQSQLVDNQWITTVHLLKIICPWGLNIHKS